MLTVRFNSRLVFILLCFIGIHILLYLIFCSKVKSTKVFLRHNRSSPHDALELNQSRPNDSTGKSQQTWNRVNFKGLRKQKSFNERSLIMEYENEKDNHYVVCPNTPYARLGNKMFEYAGCLGIATTLNYQVVLDPDFPLLKYFNIKKTPAIKLSNLMTVSEQQWRDKNWRTNKTYLSHNLTLTGFFQAWTYFNNITDRIWKSFAINEYYLDQARTFLRNSVPGIKTRVCVHIRRGDFMSKGSRKAGRVVASREYINNSMNYFREMYTDVYFIIVTEEIDWTWENIFGDDFVFSSFNSAIVDLAIMSLCDHAIVTVGTFSWWGGWLTGGTVIYLKDFPRPGSELDQTAVFIREEYYPPAWIGMTNG